MPTIRREQRAAAAHQWGAWLQAQLARRGMKQVDLVNASDGVIQSGTLARWIIGDNTASAPLAITVADLLDADDVAALRAAGHDAIADRLESKRRRNPDAKPWSKWVRDASHGTGYDLTADDPTSAIKAWIAQSDGTLDEPTLLGWRDGTAPATATAAILAAAILGRDMIEAARAAGHSEIADIAERILASDRMKAARAVLADYGLPAGEEAKLIRSYAQDLAHEDKHALEVLRLRAQVAQNKHGITSKTS